MGVVEEMFPGFGSPNEFCVGIKCGKSLFCRFVIGLILCGRDGKGVFYRKSATFVKSVHMDLSKIFLCKD